MRMKILLWLLVGVMAIWVTGCVSTVDGRHKAGWPLGKDKIEGRYEKKPQEIWVAAKDVLKYLGTITGEDQERSVLEANVDTRTVWVKVEEVDPGKISRVVVQARKKGGTADLELASFIEKQIAVRLATGNLTPTAPGRRAY
jgi:hypothetical protein